MNNNNNKTKTAILGGIVAMSLLTSLANADIIFSDNFSEFSPVSGGYTNDSIPGYTSSLNQIAWTPTGSATHAYAYGLSTISTDYGSSAGETTPIYVYLANYAGGVETSVLTNTGSAVDLNTAANYTLTFDLGDRGSNGVSNDTVVELLAGSTVIGSQTYDDTSITSGQFAPESISVLSSSLVGDSGALSIEVLNGDSTNPGYHTDFTNVQSSDTVVATPEPGTWAMLLGGLGTLFFFQRMRRGHKV